MWDGNDDERYPLRNYAWSWRWDDNFNLIQVRGFECPPQDPDVRWFPDLGYSTIGPHHTNVSDAENARKAALVEEIILTEKRLEVLKGKM